MSDDTSSHVRVSHLYDELLSSIECLICDYYGCPLRSKGKPLCFTAVLYSSSSSSSLFQKVIYEVTERIPLILSHNIRPSCNLIMHLQKLVDLYPTEKSPKMVISETESDIRWRITLKWNFTSTIAAVRHYEGPSSVNPQNAWTLTPKWGLVWVEIRHPIVKFGTPSYLGNY